MLPGRKLLLIVALVVVALLLWRMGRPREAVAPPPVSPTPANTAPAEVPTAVNRSAPAPDVRPARAPGNPLAEILRGLSKDSVPRQAELDRIAASIPDAELQNSLDLIWDEKSEGARELRPMLLRRWTEKQPEMAATWLFQKSDSAERRELAVSVATVWANQNVSNAADWVRQWPAEQKTAGLLAVGYEAARKSPREALWLASELPPGEARNDLVQHAVSQWAAADPVTPIAWAAKMEPSPLRDQVIANLSLALAETDPQGAATLAIESLPQGKTQSDVVVGIVQRWVQKDPKKTAAWVAAFPDGQLRDTSLENMILLWSDQSPEGAAGWLNKIEHGPDRDIGVAALARKVAAADPSAAARWVESMTDPERRLSSAESLAERWLAMDPAKAREWLATAEIPAERKTALLAQAGRADETNPASPVEKPSEAGAKQ